MKRTKLITIHIAATLIAALTISSFFTFSLIAEIMGAPHFIQQVKTGILYCLPILLIAMPMLVLSGKKLAGNSKDPLIAQKMKRMKFVAVNGVILISLAIYLYYHATYKNMDSTFLYVQILELVIGVINLSMIGKNIRAGMQLSGRRKKFNR